MARGFGTTDGVGTTDRLTSTYDVVSGGTVTIAAWIWITGAGGGGVGRIFTNAAGSRHWWYDNAAGTLVFIIGYSPLGGFWAITAPTLGAWHHVAVTYDGASTANDPLIYLNGVSVAVTETQSPSGTILTAAAAWIIGNENGGAGGWNGRLAEFGHWTRLLSADEIAGLAKGGSPAFIPHGLVLYYPLLGRYSPEDSRNLGPNYPGTLTGTVYRDHPRILSPSPPHRFSRALAAPIQLAAALTGSGSLAAALTTQIQLVSALTGSGSLAAALTTQIQLAAALTGSAQLAAAVTTQIQLASALTGSAQLAAALTTQIQLAAALTGSAQLAAALTTQIQLVSALTGSGSLAAALSTQIHLASALAGSAQLAAALTTQIHLASALSAAGALAAALSTDIRLAAALVGSGSLAGVLSTAIQLQAQLAGSGTLSAQLAVLIVRLIRIATVFGSAPTLDRVTGTAPTLDRVTGTAPTMTAITGVL